MRSLSVSEAHFDPISARRPPDFDHHAFEKISGEAAKIEGLFMRTERARDCARNCA
jgi:hypothetical protein